MSYEPQFTIRTQLLSLVESVAALRERIQGSTVDEYYWEDRPGYYAALEAVRHAGEDLTGWLEYCAEGLRQTLERVWLRVQAFNLKFPEKLVLRPRQAKLQRVFTPTASELRL